MTGKELLELHCLNSDVVGIGTKRICTQTKKSGVELFPGSEVAAVERHVRDAGDGRPLKGRLGAAGSAHGKKEKSGKKEKTDLSNG